MKNALTKTVEFIPMSQRVGDGERPALVGYI